MAISTQGVTLNKGTVTSAKWTWTKLIDIKDFPDLGGSPEMLETTTLSDTMQTYIPGIQSSDALEFTANYSSTDYATIVALKDTETGFALYFGKDGAGGKYYFKGYASVRINGGGVNEVVTMTITIAPSTAISTTEPAAA